MRRAGKRSWGALFIIGALAVTGCRSNNTDDAEKVHRPPPEQLPGDGGAAIPPDAGPPDAGTPDAGPVTAPPDGGTNGDGVDGGTPGEATDGGTTGGTPDGGTTGGGTDGGTVELPTLDGWQFFGVQQGGPHKVYGVSSDMGGNIWVAGGAEGLFLLRPGADHLQRFTVADGLTSYTDGTGTHGYDVISVAGGPDGTVFAGYHGLGESDNDPPYMVKSGDADRVTLTPGGIDVFHFDISTPPGVDPHYPQGRDKIRHVHRILYNRATGDVWFGGGHGVALWDGKRNAIFEHQHAAINGYTAAGDYTLLSGDWSVALDGAGDLWMGGAHRLARLQFATQGRQYWADLNPIVDVWPDAVPEDARPDQRTDDFVQDLAVTRDGRVWVGSIPNSLAVLGPSGTTYVRDGMVDRKITSLEADPSDDSVWVGHIYGGITRFKDGQQILYDWRLFGAQLIEGTVPDIQSDTFNGQRRILVAFDSGAIGIYTGK